MHPLLALLFLVPPLWGLVVAVQDRDRARAHLWAGAAWAVAYLALTAPAILFQGFQMRPELVLPGQQLDRTAELAFYAALWAGVFATSGAAFAWNVVVGATAAAQWHAMAAWGEREGASGGPFAPRWLGWAFGLGVAAAVLSWSAFEYLGVADSGFLASRQPTLPGLQAGPPWAVVLFAVLYVLSLALYEELLLRGVLLGNLLRNVGGSPVADLLCVVGVAALFAVLHVPNTTFPAAKVTQMFVLGLAFGELARRQGLTAAIACHAGLNVGGVLLAAATA